MLDPSDRNGGGRRARGMREFVDFIDCKGLPDVSIGGLRYTWSNFQERPKMSKLDRFLVLAEWDNLFPFLKGEPLPRAVSDHVPILLNGKIQNSALRPFKFENMWMRHHGFKDLVENWWSQFQVQGKPTQ